MLARRLLVLLALVAVWSVGLLVGAAAAAPAAPVVRELRQPDGHGFAARQWGDEHGHGWETTDGFSVVADRASGFWEYAIPGAHGRLVASGHRPGEQPPPGPRHLRPDATATGARAPSSEGDAADAGTAALAPSYSMAQTVAAPAHLGVEPSLVLLVEFDDQQATTTVADWRGRYFGERNSVRDYFDEVSYGAFTFAPAYEIRGAADGVIGWLNLGARHPDFERMGEVARWDAQAQLAADALRAANPFVRYSRYDRNGDKVLTKDELHVTVIVAGREASYGGVARDNAVWAHQADLFAAREAVWLDGVLIGDGYTMFGEKHGTHVATLRIMVHEMGHDIDWPDLYDTGDGGEGVGVWSIMGTGAWLEDGGHPGSTPSHPDAFLKYLQGWISPSAFRGTRDDVTLEAAASATAPTVVRLLANPSGVDWSFLRHSGLGQYFLVENRQRTGYDAGLPGCGVLVWHIDESRTATNFANATDSHRLVDLEEAGRDLFYDLLDPFLGIAGTAFGDHTRPSSDLYSGAKSGVTMSDVSQGSCATPGTVTADFVVE